MRSPMNECQKASASCASAARGAHNAASLGAARSVFDFFFAVFFFALFAIALAFTPRSARSERVAAMLLRVANNVQPMFLGLRAELRRTTRSTVAPLTRVQPLRMS